VREGWGTRFCCSDGSALATLVIAGSGRGAGKTAVGCALIAALPEWRWTAVKVSPHRHLGDAAIHEELDRGSEKDTGRYLAAGARQAFLVSAVEGESGRVLGEFGDAHADGGALLIESGRGLDAFPEALFLIVLAGPADDWKKSLHERLGRADGLVLAGGLTAAELPGVLRGKSIFCLAEGGWSTPELVEFVQWRLLAASTDADVDVRL
jgi:hypothetical protein